MRRRAACLLLLSLAVARAGAAAPAYIDNRPMGTAEAPLVLRSYLPDPGIEDSVFAHHHRGKPAAEYNPEAGEDIPGIVQPIGGVPAGIAVNLGPGLSYVFDTTEGRLLYAWQGGFLDMYPYWGDEESRGSMLYRDYVPRLVGRMFYLASGRHPLEIDGRSVSEFGPPHFVGYDLVDGQPVLITRYGRHTVRLRILPLSGSGAMRLEFAADSGAALSYRTEDPRFQISVDRSGVGVLALTLRGPELAAYEGYSRKPPIDRASVAAGEAIYRNYGCIACHSTDGTRSIGPSFVGLFGRQRPISEGPAVKADEAYLLESIQDPNAKVAEGFSRSLMPSFTQLHALEYESLILFIKSLAEPN